MTEQTMEQAPDVAAAEQEAVEAEQLLAALEEKVLDGDETVTPQALSNARELGTFARLRAEAARRKAEKAAAHAEETERKRMTAEAVALVEEQGDPQKVAKAYEQARTAVAELLAAVDDHDQAVREAVTLLRKAGAPPLMRAVPGPVAGEWERTPASRTAPTVEHQGETGALSLGEGQGYHAVGTGPVLSVLAADFAGQVKMPTGQTEFTRAPLQEQARRYGDQVRAFLNQAAGGAK